MPDIKLDDILDRLVASRSQQDLAERALVEATEDRDNAIAIAAGFGVSGPQIAGILGLSVPRVYQVLEARGVEVPSSSDRNEVRRRVRELQAEVDRLT